MTKRLPDLHLIATTTLVALLATFVTLVGGAGLATAATDVPDKPGSLMPGPDDSVSSLPQLSWDRVDTATKYTVQVSANANFTNPLWNRSTVNVHSTPNVQLPVGRLYWRVAAVNGSGTSPWSESGFSRNAVSAPVQNSPANDESLAQPDQPLTFSWTPVPTATGYQVDVGTDPSFVDPALIKTYAASGTTLQLAALPATGSYYWRVRAKLGVGFNSEWSTVRGYTITGLAAPQLQGPPNTFDTAVSDVELDWTPVPGAATYELQIDTDNSFDTPDLKPTGIVGTRYSPPTRLRSDQYYWRVRAADASGNKPSWSDSLIWTFDSKWLDQPEPVYPTEASTVGDPVYFQWTPVDRASSYTLQLSTDVTFQTGVSSCDTVHTTYVADACRPSLAGQTYFWRVLAEDNPSGQDSVALAANRGSFVYDPTQVDLVSPAAGDTTVTIPTLTWEPTSGALRYRVTLTNTATSVALAAKETNATTLTWQSTLPVGATYRWSVQAIDAFGRVSAAQPATDQPTFTVTAAEPATATAPDATGPQHQSSHRFPTLTWAPTANATLYYLWIKKPTSSTFTRLGTKYPYAAGEDTGTAYTTPGTYEWYAQAYTGSTAIAAEPVHGSFTIADLDEVTGYAAALSGTSATGDAGTTQDTCPATLPNTCQNLRQTPLLTWDATPEATEYRLYIARDQEMTNVLSGYPKAVKGTMWMLPSNLEDSQAGSAYFWNVLPCGPSGCAAPTVAAHAFNKQTVAPIPAGPTSGREVSDDVRLEWSTWVEAESDPSAKLGPASPAFPSGTSLINSAATDAARTYTVQTSIKEDFSTTLESIDVDQTWLTSFATTYPEGPIFWRVRAKDENGVPSVWSDGQSFVKRSPVPQLLLPAAGSPDVRGDQAFVWQPLAFAASYDIEVYKNHDDAANPGNLVFRANSKQPSYAPATPLPASQTPYTWRVRRVDAKGRVGDWSCLTLQEASAACARLHDFTVTGPAPTQVSPTAGATDVEPRGAVFTWEPEARASTYQWSLRKVGTATATTVTTPATAWAPETAIADGEWEWQVAAVDTAANVLGRSAWHGFTVHDPPVEQQAVSISGNGQVGTSLSIQAPVWVPSIDSTRITYQWYRGTPTSQGTAIAGANTAAYTIVAADLDKSIRVVATGTRPGYNTATSTSNAIIGGQGAALTPSTQPTITGSPAVGGDLTVSPGTWPGTPTYAYQWYRSRKVINGATRSTYRVVPDDAGQELAVLVTATVAGYAPGVAAGGPVRVRQILSRTTVTPSASRITSRQRVSATVQVLATGVASPTGKILVLDGRRTVASAKLKSTANGVVVVKLPRLAKGKHKITARYSGSTPTTPSKSRAATIKVTR